MKSLLSLQRRAFNKTALMATVVALVGGLAMATAPTMAAGAKIGADAPEFSLKSANGAAVSLRDYKGKLVVLEWTNHDCPFVQKHYSGGNMQTLQRDAAKAGVVWLTIISSAPGEQGAVSADEANALSARRGATPAQVLFDPDGKVGRAYGARTTPHMYVVKPDGKLAYMGGIDDKPSTSAADIETARNHVREALAELGAGKAVSTPQSRPYGCSIKYAS